MCATILLLVKRRNGHHPGTSSARLMSIARGMVASALFKPEDKWLSLYSSLCVTNAVLFFVHVGLLQLNLPVATICIQG